MKTFLLSLLIAMSCLHVNAQMTILPDNRKNPYDYIGINHNAGLDFIIAKYPAMSGQFFTENWNAIISDFLGQKQLDARIFLNTTTNPKVNQQCGPFSFYTDQLPEDELARYYKQGLLSEIQYNKINEIYDQVNNIDDMLAQFGGDAKKAYSLFYNNLLKLETTFNSLPDDDKNYCYMISSMANHSIWYWLNEGSKSHSPWGVPKCSSGGMRFSWGRLGASDVAGAVSGAVRAAVVGAVSGPAGIAAIGVAALGGGIGASAGYAILSLFGF